MVGRFEENYEKVIVVICETLDDGKNRGIV